MGKTKVGVDERKLIKEKNIVHRFYRLISSSTTTSTYHSTILLFTLNTLTQTAEQSNLSVCVLDLCAWSVRESCQPN